MNNPMARMAAALFLCGGVAGCGEGLPVGQDTVADGETLFSFGVVTQVDPLVINGVAYSTDEAQIAVEGSAVDGSALKPGMVVSVVGPVNAGRSAGVARQILYEDELEADVNRLDNTARRMTIMGQEIRYDANTVFAGVTPTTLPGGAVVEVSGFRSFNGSIAATRVEYRRRLNQTGEVMTLKGVVHDVDPQAKRFRIGSRRISYTSTSSTSGPKNGEFIAVTTNQIVLGDVLASGMHRTSDIPGLKAPARVRMQGVVEGDPGTPLINGLFIQLTGGTRFDNGSANDLTAGAVIILEGEYTRQQELAADRIRFLPAPNLSLDGQLQAGSDGERLRLAGRTIRVNPLTIVRDGSSTADPGFGPADLVQGRWVHVEAYSSGGGWVATRVEAVDSPPS